MAPGKPSRRRNARVFCGATAKAEGPRGPIKGVCRSISLGGIFFLGGTLPVGKSLEVTIELPEVGEVKAVAEVRYHHQYPEGQGMGLRFTRISQEDLSRIERFVSKVD
ncbi:MAG: PilZ domain-containing protein [Myxococcales bacterium]|nr:PilZ domain-containing protein [Myxococcales bacterium]